MRTQIAGRLAPLVEAGIPLDMLPFGYPRSAYLRSIGFSPALAAHVRALVPRCDVVHAEGAWGHTTLAAVRAAKRHRRPVVLTPHESLTAFDLSHGRSIVQRWLKGAIKRYYGRVIDAVIFSSSLELRDSVEGTSPHGSVVIPHPVYDEEGHPAARRVFELDPRSQFRLGYLGRLHPKKNVDRLLDALASLPANVSLAVAGSGEPAYAAALHKRALHHDVADRVSWLGFIDGDDKAAFLRHIDLLAMPSAYECFGMAAAEGMIAGTPVIVTPDTGVADVVRSRGAGIVVPPEPAAIGQSIVSLVNDRGELSRLSQNAMHAAAEAFSFRAHGQALMRLYTRVAS